VTAIHFALSTTHAKCNNMSILLCVVDRVMGVTKLHDVVYVLCDKPSTIKRFKAAEHADHERMTQLEDIAVNDLRDPKDIAACKQTCQVYVADSECIWRMSADGTDRERWLTTPPSGRHLRPHTLSVTATRLLVTSYGNSELMRFDADGNELRHVSLPEGTAPYHAVESPSGRFIVIHSNTQLKQWQVSEVNSKGEILRQFNGSLSWPDHIAIDSQGNVFAADTGNHRILLLDTQLVLRHVIIDERQLNNQEPRRLCYVKQSGQLLVGFNNSFMLFEVLQVCQVSEVTPVNGMFQSNSLKT